MSQHDDETARRLLRKQEKWAEADQRALDEALGAMLLHPQTRRYLYWLLEITHTGQNAYRGNFGDTAFGCGEQNIGNQIMAHLVECAPDGYLTLLKERSDERNNRANELNEIRSGVERGGEPDRPDAGASTD